MYCIGQMKWTKLKVHGDDVPLARFGHSFHAISPNEIILYGGFVQSDKGATFTFSGWDYCGSPSNDVYVFNITKLQWRKLNISVTSGPLPTFFHASCVEKGLLVVHGGYTTYPGEPCGSTHVLDISSLQEWRHLDNDLAPRACHGMAGDGEGFVYVFGDQNMDDTVLYKFGLENGHREQTGQTSGPLGRRFLSLAYICGRLVCFGGESKLGCTTDVYVYKSGIWSRPLYDGAALSVRGQQASVVGDKLMIFGGIKAVNKLVCGKNEKLSFTRKFFFVSILELNAQTATTKKYKVVTVGDSGVGKSCLLTRFVSDVYSDFHVSTIGVDFKTIVTMVSGKLVCLQLWDTAGQERFSVVTGNYYRGADGFVIVYDSTNRNSFEHVDQWIKQIQQHHDCQNTVLILCGNKHDLTDQVVVSETEGKEKAAQLGAIFVATSAKTCANVDLAFLSGAQKLVENNKQSTNNRGVSLSAPATPNISCCKA